MPKTRMSSLDIRAMVGVLQSMAVGLRVANIYNVGSKIYILKMARGETKHFILLESGTRIHSTEWHRDKLIFPSAFTMKLRKHLRTKRLEDIRQLGVDRVVQLTFGTEERAMYLIIEFYVKGNIVVTNHKYEIVLVLRRHSYDEETKVAVREVYPISSAVRTDLIQVEGFTSDEICANFHKFIMQVYQAVCKERQLTNSPESPVMSETAATKKKSSKKKIQTKPRGATAVTIKDLFFKIVPFAHPAMINHCLAKNHLESSLSVDLVSFNDSQMVENMRQAIQESLKLMYLVTTRNSEDKSHLRSQLKMLCRDYEFEGSVSFNDEFTTAVKESMTGWILVQARATILPVTAAESSGIKGTQPSDSVNVSETYSDFSCVLFDNWKDYPVYPFCSKAKKTESSDDIKSEEPILHGTYLRCFETFSQCVDTYFSSLEIQMMEKKAEARVREVEMKVDKIKEDQSRRLNELVQQQLVSERYAMIVEQNADFVDAAINMMRSALSLGIQWDELEFQIRSERRNGHPIASHVASINLKAGTFSLLLPSTLHDDESNEDSGLSDKNSEDSDDDDHENMRRTEKKHSRPAAIDHSLTRSLISVSLDISKTAMGNVQKLQGQKKMDREKVVKTEVAMIKAVSVAEKKAADDMESTMQSFKNVGIRKIRKHFWFEKFLWFISSENFLVIGGHDATQNELLYRRYLESNDVYIHADIQGASSCIVKNPSKNVIPPATLHEAGQMSICRSSAWQRQMVTSAWWVNASQVSKTAPTGEYLTTGAFMIRGKKNYLPPLKLEMGFALFFQIDEDSVGRHKGERKSKYAEFINDKIVNDARNTADVNQPPSNPAVDVESTSDQDFTLIFPNDVTFQAEGLPALENIESDDEKDKVTADGEEGRQYNTNVCESGEGDAIEMLDEKTPSVADEWVVDDIISPTASNSEEHYNVENIDEVIEPFVTGTADSDLVDISPGKKKMSRAERRHVKNVKIKNLKEELKGHTSEHDIDVNNKNELQNIKPKKTKEINVFNTLPRGKRTKYKLAQKKYCDQDEEEREVALRLLGSKPMKVGADLLPEEKATANDTNENDVSKSTTLTSKPVKIKPFEKRERKEIKQLLMDEGDIQTLKDLDEKVSQIDFLTGNPNFNEDAILFTIPVCAPFPAIQNYTYKVKLLPGSMKVGKAAQQALKLFVNQSKRDVEKRAVRQLEFMDVTNCMISSVKLSVPGITKIQKQIKQEKKKQAKKKASEDT